jgi:uncharacterized membrane protein
MYYVLKWAHVVSSTFLLTVSIGMAALPLEDIRKGSATVTMNRLGVLIVRAVVSLAVFSQVASAFAILWVARYPLYTRWLEWSMALFALLCCFWLAMAWCGISSHQVVGTALKDGPSIPSGADMARARWRRPERLAAMGWLAVLGVLIVAYLMLEKPALRSSLVPTANTDMIVKLHIGAIHGADNR